MKIELKIILAIIITFTLAFLTSALLEITFISRSWPRYILVILIMVMELAIGLMYIKSEVVKIKNKE